MPLFEQCMLGSAAERSGKCVTCLVQQLHTRIATESTVESSIPHRESVKVVVSRLGRWDVLCRYF